jgi:RNA polymerase sigma-70 factor (ECF subfamily)
MFVPSTRRMLWAALKRREPETGERHQLAERRREDPIGPALDRSLIDRARNGDLEAFETIVRARMDAVYRLTSAILGDEADARDATQETFVAAWREIARVRQPERFDAWLQRIAINASRMTLRSRGRRRVREIPSSQVFALASRADDVDRASLDAARLDAALRRLSVDQRAILVLHHLEGQPVTDLAVALDIPVGTAKSRLFHARRALDAALRAIETDR